MYINLKSNIDFYIVIAILIILFISGIKKTNQPLNRDTTDSLKGLSILVIMCHHVSLNMPSKTGLFFELFRCAGFLGVSVFLFISGYGLQKQIECKTNYNRTIPPKVLYLLYIFVASDAVCTVINNLFFHTRYNAINLFRELFHFKYPNGRELWFAAAIIVCYLSFYIANRISGRYSAIIVFFLLSAYALLCIRTYRGSWWYNTIFCFLFGMIYAKRNISLNIRYTAAILPFALLMYIYQFKQVNRLQYVIPFLFLITILSMFENFELNNRFLRFVNTFTFELYLTHLIVLKIVFVNDTIHYPGTLIFAFLLIFGLAYVTHLFCKYSYSAITALCHKVGK